MRFGESISGTESMPPYASSFLTSFATSMKRTVHRGASRKTRQEILATKRTAIQAKASEDRRKEAKRFSSATTLLRNRVYNSPCAPKHYKASDRGRVPSDSKRSGSHWNLGFGTSLEVGIWSLELSPRPFRAELHKFWFFVHLCALACDSVRHRAAK